MPEVDEVDVVTRVVGARETQRSQRAYACACAKVSRRMFANVRNDAVGEGVRAGFVGLVVGDAETGALLIAELKAQIGYCRTGETMGLESGAQFAIYV